jgi:hypothetical protein
MDVKFLLKVVPWEVSVRSVDVPMFVPGLGLIPRDIVCKVISKTRIQRCPSRNYSVRIWHCFSICLI